MCLSGKMKRNSRGRQLVAMSLQEISPTVNEELLCNPLLTSVSNSNSGDISIGNIFSTSELITAEDLGIDLPPASDSFLSIYKETQKLLLETVPFQDYDFDQDINNCSFVDNSDETSDTDGQRQAKRIKILANSSPSEIESNSMNKPSVTIPETPEHPFEDYSEQSTVTNAQNFEDPGSPELLNQRPFTTENQSEDNKIIKNRQKHPMGDPCEFKCNKKCVNFSREERGNIWDCFWRLTHDNRLKWAAAHMQLISVQSRRNPNQEKYKRHETRLLFLPHANGQSENVCKRFFLSTLGYKCDSILTTISKKLNSKPSDIVTDNRGTNPKPKTDTTKIKEFINLYNPCTAHYRRHNSPKMRYLSQDIGLNKLYLDFKERNPTFVCCKEIFRLTLKEMHISLRRPQNDKCYDCLTFDLSINNALKASTVPTLKLLCREKLHKTKAAKATEAYKKDSLKEDADTKIYSMDLQKTVLLPMIPEVKDCFFTNRLVGLNLTFCGLRKETNEGSKCIVWHEGTGGRDGKDIVDAIYKFIRSERDAKNFILWADNCSAQNKNWILFTSLVVIVNLHDIDSITIKYLTKGHTHMSADGVHGNIETYLNKTKNVYDFQDYKQCLKKSRKNNEVIEVQSEDKYKWEKKKKATSADLKTFLLKNIVEVKFLKNQNTLLYKKSFDDEASYVTLDFIQKRFKVDQLPKQNSVPRGVRSSKKQEIISKLVPLMPISRQAFWHALPQSDNVGDLIRDEALMQDV